MEEMEKKEDFSYLYDAADEELMKFISGIEEAGLMTAPKSLKENVLKQVGEEQMKVSATIKKPSDMKKSFNKRKEFVVYSIKIASAVAAAIFLLCVMNLEGSFKRISAEDAPRKEITVLLNDAVSQVGVGLNEISTKIAPSGQILNQKQK